MTAKQKQALNNWIARNVMGWSPHKRNTAYYVKKSETGKLGCEYLQLISCWNPTYDKHQAFKVMESLAVKKDSRVWVKPTNNGGWDVGGDWDADGILFHPRTHAPTLPLAICLFAKEALK